MIVTTSICANYLPKAMVLAKSLKKTNPNVRMIVCLMEHDVPDAAKDFPYFDSIILAKDMDFDNFNKFIFKHSIVEASTSVKGQLFVHMLKAFPEENKFVYLDPDISVYGEMKELDSALDSNDIVLTPHLCHPEDSVDAVMDNELCALQHGVFNLGFLAVKRSREGERFAKWWASRLSMFCYDDIPRGIFTDQKWVDLAPCFFDVHILKHPGYNVAPWNVSKRKITFENNEYLVNGEPLRFFHFSGFDSGSNEGMITKYVPDRTAPVYSLRNAYVEDLDSMGQQTLGKMPWFYDRFVSGEKIERSSRIIFRDNGTLRQNISDPFLCSNSLFKKSARKKLFTRMVKKIIRKFR